MKLEPKDIHVFLDEGFSLGDDVMGREWQVLIGFDSESEAIKAKKQILENQKKAEVYDVFTARLKTLEGTEHLAREISDIYDSMVKKKVTEAKK